MSLSFNKELLETAVKAGLEAGKLLKEGINTIYEISYKDGLNNLVTEYDKKAEEIIINIIKTNLLQFFMRYSEIYMPALRALQDAPELQRLLRGAADAGGSKRVNNKSRKNKYKRKYNHKYKKSRKNKRHRRKRTQSNQNKMF